VPAIVQIVGFVAAMPESPRYLIEIDERDEASRILRRIRGKENVDEEVNRIVADIEVNRGDSFLSLFNTENGRHALFVGCSLQFFQQFTGINTVMYYSATIIYMSGIVTSPSAAIWLSALTSSMNFIFTLVGLYTIERAGRRKLALLSVLGSAFSLAVLSGGFYWSQQVEPRVNFNATNSACDQYYGMGCSSCVSDDACSFCFHSTHGSCDLVNVSHPGYFCENHTITKDVFWSDTFCPKNQASWLSLVGMMLYLVSFAPGMGPVPWAVNAEIYPQSCRESGMAVSTSVNWVSNCVVSLTFLSILNALGTPGGFLLYFGFGILAFITMFLTLPETKSIPLEDIPSLLRRGWCIPCISTSYTQFENEEAYDSSDSISDNSQ